MSLRGKQHQAERSLEFNRRAIERGRYPSQFQPSEGQLRRQAARRHFPQPYQRAGWLTIRNRDGSTAVAPPYTPAELNAARHGRKVTPRQVARRPRQVAGKDQ